VTPAPSGIITIDWTKPPARKFREVIQPAFASSQRRIRPIRAERRAGLIRAIARGRQWLNEIVAGTTSERIRDKIAASKRKGLWVGGPLPLGYHMKDDKIAVVEDEAERVRLIYRRYLELGDVNALVQARRQARLRATASALR
jgi:hypothetical protein